MNDAFKFDIQYLMIGFSYYAAKNYLQYSRKRLIFNYIGIIS